MSIHTMKKSQILLFSTFYFLLAGPANSADDEAYIIIDNTAGLESAAIMSNMPTSRTDTCSKNNVLVDNVCNGFALGNNEIQVVQNNGSGGLVSMIGVDNSGSTDYNNAGTLKQTFHFADGKELFKLGEFRSTANKIAALKNVTNTPAGTFGSLSFEEFLMNIALNRTMYGIVRVKLPLILDSSPTPGSISKKNKHNKTPFKKCGQKPSAACNKCGPGPGTVIEAGSTICGITLPANAQINVKGSLMFDWVNCSNDQPVALTDFPDNPAEIDLPISIPLNINAANIDATTLKMSTVSNIQQITGSNRCTTGSPCNVPLETPIDFSLVPQESLDMYQYKVGVALTDAIFSTLTRSDQYHLLFPSGYADGWSNAFSTLGITSATWNQWGFETPAASGLISANSVRDKLFEDIPALTYTGGLIEIKNHTNISGLIYAAQAIEISQGSSNPQVPTYQYFNGAIIVRDGFYFEATNPGGITLVSNDPDSYSNTKLNPDNTIRTNFQPLNNPDDDSVLTNQSNQINGVASSNKGPQWVEIRPK